MPIVDAFGRQVVSRLLDFFSDGTPWYRRLWSSSALLALEEVLEASHAVRAGIVSEDLFGAAVAVALSLVGPDPGVGSKEAKKALQQALKKTLVPDGVDFHVVKAAAERCRNAYLRLWRDSVATAPYPGAERTARAIAAHLLDAGFSLRHLHRWCTYQVNSTDGANSLPELINAAAEMYAKPIDEFSVLVSFQGIPKTKSGLPSNHMSAEEVVNWLAVQGMNSAGVQQNGALLFRVPARDPWAAVEKAVDTVENLSARVALGTDARLIPARFAWVEGIQRRFNSGRRNRRVQVRALHREDKLYTVEDASIVDAALLLIGALNAGPPSTATAAGWAAVEALLTGPADADVLAGTRLASLVACSFPRAELTALSYKLQNARHPIAEELRRCNTNRERAKLVARYIADNDALPLDDESDKAAVQRMATLLRNPYESFRDIHNHVSAVFTRMYKNRNLVIHWGKTDAIGLASNLRCAAPLVGAGVDRIAHAWFVERVRPMELAARARLGLETVGAPDGIHPVDLLDKP